MGIRFHCNYCERRLNVKAKQAGEFCFCPDCENEIQIPLESTIEPSKKRRKKRRGKKSKVVSGNVESVGVANTFELEVGASRTQVFEVRVEPPSEIDSLPAETQSIVVESSANGSVAPTSPPAVREPVVDFEATTVDSVPVSVDETMVEEAEVIDLTTEASFDGDQTLDSDSALDQLLSSDEREVLGDASAEVESDSDSFLLAKPVAKIGDDPLKTNPNLVWYLRHKRLGEKGPLKAPQVEEMLESGRIRAGFIVWREDWNDWLPAEEVFASLAKPEVESPAYTIPDELNPHSETSRKRRAEKRFWMCVFAAAFLLVLVLVYCLIQFGLS